MQCLPSARKYTGLNLYIGDKTIEEINKYMEQSGLTVVTNGYVRRRNVGREEGFDWDRIGNALNGTTWVQPDELEESIKNSGQWTNGKYDVFTHNCHDFVRECLRIVGTNEGMTLKKIPVFRPIKNKIPCNIF